MTPRNDIDFPYSRAILLGTSKYTAGFGGAPMPAAANSLAAMRAVLAGPCEWPESRIEEFPDKGNRDAVLQDIAPLIHEARDVLLFYYVGHGQLLPGNDLGLALTDTSEDPRLRLSTSLRLGQLRQEMEENCEARIKIFILDCCCSGIATKYSQGPADLASQVHQAAILEGEGTYTWTACGHSQDTYFEPGYDGLTYFTKFLAETVLDGIPGRGAGLTLANIHQEVRRRLRQADLPGVPIRPEPTMLFRGPADEFAFAPNAAPASTHGKPALVPPGPDSRTAVTTRAIPSTRAYSTVASRAANQVAQANSLQAAGQYAQAEAAAREATRLDPASSIAYTGLGDALFSQDRFREAEAAFREAIRLEPSRAQAHHDLGAAIFSQDRFREAETPLREAIRLDPNRANTHVVLGDALFSQDRFREAEAAFRGAARLDPNRANAHHGVGNALFRQERFREAEAAFTQAARLGPDRAVTYYMLGEVLARLERFSQAEEEFRKVIRLNPAYPLARNNLAAILSGRGQFDEAEAQLREAIRLEPTEPRLYAMLGAVLTSVRRFTEAEAALREAIRLDPINAYAHTMLRNLYEHMRADS